MTAESILEQLSTMGEASYKNVMLKHGVKEPFYGVKIEEMKKIAKQVKNGHDIALKLYDSGIYDAMYLAGLMAEPQKMTRPQLQKWAQKANAPILREYTAPWVAAESPYGLEKALEWIASGNEHLSTTGWATLSSVVTITQDKDLDMQLLKDLLKKVAATIHASGNREKLAMNGFVMAVGIHVKELNELAKQTAREIGKVKADMGDTACKIPVALEYIEKAEGKNAIGKKKRSARCL
ncbi:DNA alkylation repair protein [Nemorincola caseinilytica]|uniref:DNA alkylation repair protein n=1 Tax=Nemorincola caseinilytica TaxID=2054315 RepID=A0ABP8NGK4_9BACT